MSSRSFGGTIPNPFVFDSRAETSREFVTFQVV